MQRLAVTPVSFTPARTSLLGALVCAGLLIGCKDASEPVAPRSVDAATLEPVFTLGSGSSSTLLGRATFSDPSDPVLKVKRITDKWQMELKAMPGFDLAIQTI